MRRFLMRAIPTLLLSFGSLASGASLLENPCAGPSGNVSIRKIKQLMNLGAPVSTKIREVFNFIYEKHWDIERIAFVDGKYVLLVTQPRIRTAWVLDTKPSANNESVIFSLGTRNDYSDMLVQSNRFIHVEANSVESYDIRTGKLIGHADTGIRLYFDGKYEISTTSGDDLLVESDKGTQMVINLDGGGVRHTLSPAEKRQLASAPIGYSGKFGYDRQKDWMASARELGILDQVTSLDDTNRLLVERGIMGNMSGYPVRSSDGKFVAWARKNADNQPEVLIIEAGTAKLVKAVSLRDILPERVYNQFSDEADGKIDFHGDAVARVFHDGEIVLELRQFGLLTGIQPSHIMVVANARFP